MRDKRYAAEIVCRRWGIGCPFQRARIPWIGRSGLPVSRAPERVHQEQPETDEQNERAHSRQQIQGAPPHLRKVGVNAPRHTLQAENMHWKKRDVKSDE